MTVSHNVTAVLGPTNTGKTHLAVERMLASSTGMIGLPLRLLAREVFDKVRARAGAHNVALITGEEKIIPAQPRYWICTVEAMPGDIDVSFLAVDEIQLAGDFERGHIFTDRLLHRRGRDETMLLGADTIRPLIAELLPYAKFSKRPRFSNLTYSGQKKLTRLPRRSAIVAFSTETVYSLAELIRRQRGGAAVVLGALSPRTRNAQVALYQSGDVDYVVATDAIGMGLNMDVDHVAFAATRKFDGFQFRNLTPAELGQIAGRAGRHMNDGTFGVTAEAAPFDAETIERLEGHRFERLRMMQWRNRNLSFKTIDQLLASLGALPKRQGLTRARPAADVEALELLARDQDFLRHVSSGEQVERLWEVCQVPDYRNITGAEHANLISRVFQFLSEAGGVIPDDWFARQLAHCDRSDGDIDTLSNRIAHIRTWTFIANRPDWLKDPVHWQERARSIEDKLSDALHERLTQRFIDRRTAVLMRRLRQKEELMSTVEEDGGILVEGEFVGHIKGFRFMPDGADGAHGKAVRAASLKAVAKEITGRAQTASAAPDTDFVLVADGAVTWQGAAIGRLKAGANVLKPGVDILADDQLSGPDRDAVQFRLEKFLSRHIRAVLAPLIDLSEADDVTGLSRGLAFRLVEELGVVPREDVALDVKSLGQEERATLRKYGVRFGAVHVFLPAMLKPAATELRLLLWILQAERDGRISRDPMPVRPGQGLTSVPVDRSSPEGFYRLAGFKICGNRAVRVDMLERLADLIRARVFWRSQAPADKRPEGSVEGGGFTVISDMMSLVGCSGEEFADILKALGYRMERRVIEPPPAGQRGAATSDPVLPVSDDKEVALAQKTSALSGAGAEADSQPADVDPGVATPDAATGAASVETREEEPVVLEVWWPKDTGPFRKVRRDDKPGFKPAKGKRKAGKPPGGRREQTAVRSKPKSKREPRPEDSPFAVLSALKENLTGDGER